MMVVDASAAVELLLGGRSEDIDLENRFNAPHLIDLEVTSALRRLVLGKRISPNRAAGARDDWAALPVVRYPHLPLLDRIWDLRHRLSAYDAAYVALAEILAGSFITADRRLASASADLVDVRIIT
jgi:predicted nucleic acid-binding protein